MVTVQRHYFQCGKIIEGKFHILILIYHFIVRLQPPKSD